jgi:hypothetical protein
MKDAALSTETESQKNAYVKCPFCGEDDFDLYGLKIHLLDWCEGFEKCKEPKRG